MSDLVAAARELRGHLRGRAAATEQHGVHDDETHALLRDRGFYAMLAPRRFGGAELGLGAYARVLRELAEGCPTTARAVGAVAGGAVRVRATFGADAQAELFGGGELRAASATSADARATPEDGGWSVTGTLGDAVGIRHATHVLAPALAGAEPLCVIVPRDAVTIAAGDRASPRLVGAHVAARFARPAGAEPDLWATSLAAASLAAILAGAAATAVEIYEQLVRDGSAAAPPAPPPSLDPDHQRRLGAAACRAETAALLLDQALAHQPELPPPGSSLLIGMLARESMRYSWSATEEVLRSAGPLDADRREWLERVGRATLRGLHDPGLGSEEPVARMLGRERLGLPIDP